MRIVFGLVMVVGVGLAGFAAMKTSEYINATKASEQAALRRIVPTVEVFVAKKTLPFGHVLTPDDVVAIAWPQNAVPETAFRELAVLFPGDDSKKRTIVRQMEQYEPLLASKVTEPGEDAGLNTRLARGMRAFPILVDTNAGIAGLVRLGDRVDVYWTGSAGSLGPDMQGEFTKLIESGVTIIAIGNNANDNNYESSSSARTLTIEASPQQVARLAQAQVSGKLSLALMGIGDDEAAVVTDVDRRGLLGIEAEVVAPVEAAKVCTIRNRRGSEVVEIPIPCTN